jgi:hypothetical protein
VTPKKRDLRFFIWAAIMETGGETGEAIVKDHIVESTFARASELDQWLDNGGLCAEYSSVNQWWVIKPKEYE